MKEIPENIRKFLENNSVASICFDDDKGVPHCITCFYAFNLEQAVLVFKSSFGSSHDKIVQSPKLVAGTVLPEKLDKLNIKGLQFKGKIMEALDPQSLLLSTQYYKSYPVGLVMPGYIWSVKLSFLKFTDNTLGFGNKTLWEADPDKS